MIHSICIVRLSALGDVLMLVPLIRTLQAHFPKASITWVISRPAYDLVEGMDGVEFVVIDKPKSLKDYYQFRQRVKSRTFDVLLAPQASFRANLLYPLIKTKRKIGYDRLRAKDGHRFFINETISPGNDHTLDGFLKFATPLGIETPVIEWNLPVSDADWLWAKNQFPAGKRLLIVNPASSKPERSWQTKSYIEVIKRITSEIDNLCVILTGGPGSYDRALADAIKEEVEVIDLVGKTKPKQLLGLIGLADAVLCPDTGPSHMAAAMGTPVVALHAVTSAEVSGPYTYRHYAVDVYQEALTTFMPNRPHPWGLHVHGDGAMQLISVDAVMQALKNILLNDELRINSVARKEQSGLRVS